MSPKATERTDHGERLSAAYRSMPRDRSRLCLLVGPPGCGAAGVVDRFLARARPSVAIRTIASRGRAFGTLGEVLRIGRAALGAGVVVDLSTVAERRERMLQEAIGLLERLGGEVAPVIVIEDLDRADGATLDLIDHLLSHQGSRATAFFVGTAANPRSLRAFSGGASTEVIHLDPLDEAGVRAYLSQSDVVARVLARSEGLPERIDELIEGRPLAPVGAGSGVSEVARELYAALLVLDRPCTLETLGSIVRRAPRLSHADELVSAGLARRLLREGVLALRVRTRAARDSHYEAIPAATRAELHGRAADVFEEESPEESARHAARAGQPDRALRLALRACADPASGLAGRDAAALLADVHAEDVEPPLDLLEQLASIYLDVGEGRRALRLARRLHQERSRDPEAVLLLARALVISGHLERAWEALEDGRELELAERAVAEISLRQADVAYWLGRLDEARRFATEAEASAAERGWLPTELEASCVKARVDLLAGGLDAAEARAERGQARARRAGLARHECDFVNLLGNVSFRRDELDRALFHFRQASEIADRVGAIYRWATAVGNIAVVDQLQGRFGDSAAGYRRTLRILEHTGFRNQQARGMNNLASLRAALGDPRGSLALCREARTQATEASVRLEITLIEGDALLELGSFAEARRSFERAETLADELDDAALVAEARLGLARLAHESGQRELARELAARLEGSLRARHRARLSILRARLAEPEDRVAAARSAVLAAEASGGRLLQQRARIVLALALEASGLVDLAQVELERIRELEEEVSSQLSEEDRVVFAERPEALRFLSLEARLPTGGSVQVRADDVPTGDGFIGDSAPARQLRAMVERVATTDALVLIVGESGVGKELVADAIHAASLRAEGPLVKVNCAALVDSLLLSELFGHERGAFTGAHAARKGRFELADGGTLFLDEVGEVSAQTQAALLRVLQEQTFERVGGTRTHEVDVRVIAATNRDLHAMVQEGRFREDLYYRLAGLTVPVPPLRARFGDLARLSAHFLAQIGPEMGRRDVSIAPDALAALRRHRWPGNVRELQNVLRSATLASDGPVLAAKDVRPFLGEASSELSELEQPSLTDLFYGAVREGNASVYDLRRSMERACIVRALEETGGNISRAAQLLGMTRSRVSQLVKQYDIDKNGDST